jgi:hypothetical protein
VWDIKALSPGWMGVPHLLQNWESSKISAWHLGHFMLTSPQIIGQRISRNRRRCQLLIYEKKCKEIESYLKRKRIS